MTIILLILVATLAAYLGYEYGRHTTNQTWRTVNRTLQESRKLRKPVLDLEQLRDRLYAISPVDLGSPEDDRYRDDVDALIDDNSPAIHGQTN